ncbi:hypothetical protein K1719_013337 [Acacia pycnantha]|nr:hypothetical protein K1719_013337 [Acacia pycnantha]
MAFFRNLSMFLALFFTRVFIFIIPVTSQPQPQPQACESYKFLNTTNLLACKDLPVLDSSLYWTYHSSSNSVDVAFKKNNADRKSWIAWAVNPTSTGMVGSQAFVAFQKSDGTMTAYPSPVTSYDTTLEERSLNFEVYGVSASFEDGTMILYASFKLPGNSKLVNHVWQEGPVSDDDSPLSHAFWIDWIYLNLVCPGSRTGSTWFHLHRACQILAYIIGTAGFSLGIFLSNPSLSSLSPSGFVHASIGIAVFVSATVQVLAAIFLRPDKHHKLRTFWNIFHYVIGYGVIVLSIINMFRGFSVSNTSRSWRNAYFCVIVSLGCVALTLEVITWFLAFKRRNKKTIEEISAEDNITPEEII